MRKLVYIGVALVVGTLTAALSACGSQVVEFPESAVVADPPGDTCLDENCPVGQVCQNNVCAVVDPCAGVTCPEGAVCQDGSCVGPVPDPDPCANVTCPEGSVCQDGACTPVDPCEGVTCPAGVQCVNGECPPPPDPCANGKCDAGPPKDPCDGVCCPHNKECKAGKCVPKDPCAGVQCPESRVCKGGQCVCDGDPKDDDGCGRNKTLICHKDCKGKRHDICVSDNAVPAHKRHGDKVGDCSVCR